MLREHDLLAASHVEAAAEIGEVVLHIDDEQRCSRVVVGHRRRDCMDRTSLPWRLCIRAQAEAVIETEYHYEPVDAILTAVADAGHRVTRPRTAVANLIDRRAGHFTAAELLDDARVATFT